MANEVKITVTADDKASHVAQSIDKAFMSLGKTAALGMAAGLGIATVAGAKFVNEAREAIQVEKQLDAVLKSTAGAAGVSRDAALDLANAMQRVTNYDDEAVLSAENLLLTFRSIGRDVFPQATETVLDMSAALGQDLKSSAIQLGKAMNDPVLGATALRRVGVALTEQQMEQIKAFQKSGDIMSAQKIILRELQTEFGGSARAVADPWIQLQNALGEVQETIGRALLPTVNDMASRLNAFLTEHQDDIERLATLFADKLAAGIDKVAAAAQNMINFLRPIVEAIPPEDLALIAGIIGGELVAAVVAFGIAMTIAFATNPVTQFILAIGLVTTASILLVRHWDQVWASMQAAPAAFADWFQGHWKEVVIGIFVPGGALWVIGKHWDELINKLPEPVRSVAKSIAAIFDTMVNAIIAAIEWMLHRLGDLGAQIAPIMGGINKVLGFLSGGKLSLPDLSALQDITLPRADFASKIFAGGGEEGRRTGRYALDDQFRRTAEAVSGAGDAAAGAVPSFDGLADALGDGGLSGAAGDAASALTPAQEGLTELARTLGEAGISGEAFRTAIALQGVTEAFRAVGVAMTETMLTMASLAQDVSPEYLQRAAALESRARERSRRKGEASYYYDTGAGGVVIDGVRYTGAGTLSEKGKERVLAEHPEFEKYMQKVEANGKTAAENLKSLAAAFEKFGGTADEFREQLEKGAKHNSTLNKLGKALKKLETIHIPAEPSSAAPSVGPEPDNWQSGLVYDPRLGRQVMRWTRNNNYYGPVTINSQLGVQEALDAMTMGAR